MKTHRITIFVIVAVLILVALLIWVYSPPLTATTTTRIKLTFIGLTNVAAKGKFAVFTVSNPGPQRVLMMPDALVHRSSQEWITNSLRNTMRRDWIYWSQDTNGNPRLRHWYDFGGDLQSGSSAVFGAPVTVTNSVWFLDFYCVEEATGIKGLADRGKDSVKNAGKFVTKGPDHYQTSFSGRRYHIMSPEISE